MKNRRDASSVIWRTVVVAGAMLAAPGCKKDNAAATTPVAPDPVAADPANPCGATEGTPTEGDGTATTETPDPCGNPCGERPRGNPCGEDGEGGMGRGFILS
ncbi:MAG: hypothetical protein KA297_07985 [Kofleriaceae bacterium]|jgi:hypothetical protein|nr:hypothetical protein [Kofleriaceae bacterium]MBP6836295.1 hypothetical protein [Kofleriaceae bacterium]